MYASSTVHQYIHGGEDVVWLKVRGTHVFHMNKYNELFDV